MFSFGGQIALAADLINKEPNHLYIGTGMAKNLDIPMEKVYTNLHKYG